MTIASGPGSLLAVLLSVILGVNPARGAEAEETSASATDNRREKHSYQRAIAAAESRGGAYAQDLPETLLGLARILQAQGQHEEAIKLFKRGTHLARINEGLYCAQQIPMVEGEIASHKARGDYALADERQNYLYRVQLQSLQDSDLLAQAYMKQALWQYQAYQLNLEGSLSYLRLMNMSELYQLAMQDVANREGETSPNLLPPLLGMLEAQYLISDYETQEAEPVFGEDGRPNESLLLFKQYRAKSFRTGNAIIEAIADIEQEHGSSDAATRAQSMVMLGDWRLWNGKTEDAWEAYKAAAAELALSDDAQALTMSFFGEPVPLPDLAVINSLPAAVAPEQADITVAFDVNEKGQVRDLERMDENEVDSRQASRLLRQLRKTTFRPRFEAGQPVETEQIVKAFAIR